MRNRLVMGKFRYGDKKDYDRIGGIRAKLDMYMKTGNTEFLVDAANLALLEFKIGNHPNKHFKSVDDKYHVEVKNADQKRYNYPDTNT